MPRGRERGSRRPGRVAGPTRPGPFPEGLEGPSKRGDPPLEKPHGERSRHGDAGVAGGAGGGPDRGADDER